MIVKLTAFSAALGDIISIVNDQAPKFRAYKNVTENSCGDYIIVIAGGRYYNGLTSHGKGNYENSHYTYICVSINKT